MGAESNEQLKAEHEARQKKDTKEALKSLNTSDGSKGCIVTLLIALGTLGLLSYSILN